MKWFIYLMFICLTSCATPKVIYQTEEKIKIDTLYIPKEVKVEIQVPYEKEVVVLPADSVSNLETSVAWSTASLLNGFLYHSLENKDVKIKGDTIIDERIIYVDKEVIVTKTEIEKERYIPKWIWIAFGLLIGVFGVLYIKK